MRFFFVLAGTIWGIPVAARAQARPDVVLMVPAEVRAGWTAALQVELAPRGASVIPVDPPEGATVLLRDAAAQQEAIDRGAAAAAWVEPTEQGWNLRLVEAGGAAPRVTPFAREADGRTLALILVSLLDEPMMSRVERPGSDPFRPPPVESRPDAIDHGSSGVVEVAPASYGDVLAAPGPPAAQTETAESARLALAEDTATGPVAADSSASPEGDRPTREPAERDPYASAHLQWSGRIGTAGLALANDRAFHPGAALRGGVGMRHRYFEVALLGEAGLLLERLGANGDQLQPFARACLELGALFPIDTAAVHLGGRACGGAAKLRSTRFFDPLSPSHFDVFGGLFSGGGYVAVSFGLARWVRFFVRMDFEGAVAEASPHDAEMIPMLSTFLSFE